MVVALRAAAGSILPAGIGQYLWWVAVAIAHRETATTQTIECRPSSGNMGQGKKEWFGRGGVCEIIVVVFLGYALLVIGV
jgi:hypothetical protein